MTTANRPEVSIIIINYNTFELTCNCIQSIYDKTKGVSFEIILVDNASVECEPEMFLKKFPEIILVKSPENVGFAKGNNLGLKHANGAVILLLNSDTELQNDAISICFNKLEKEENIGAITTKLVYSNGVAQHVCRRFPSLKLVLLETFRLHKMLSKKELGRIFLGSYFTYDREVEADIIWGAFFLFPMEVLRRFPNGKLHETYFMYEEDVEWSYYIKKVLKRKIKFYPDGLVLHKMGGSSNKNENKSLEKTIENNPYGSKYELILRNRIRFMVDHYGYLYSRLYFLILGINFLLNRGSKKSLSFDHLKLFFFIRRSYDKK